MRRSNPWIAFAAGAVAMLVVVLLWYACQGRDDAGVLGAAAVKAADSVPVFRTPRLPDAPRIPDVPTPVPK
ncbi:hypothetical protein [Phenylobacterium sp.]|uniref:hypothetical protein n=1 Tax=Phenylobacterium sp. TaxID=1871053 RepID=UPI0025CF923A|nr:hypothetical protein [Phenylobacterium sp.]